MTLGAVWNSFQIQWLVPQKASQKLLSHLSVIALAFMGRLWRTSAIRAAGVVSRQALRLSASGMEICLWSFKLLSVYLWRPCLFSKATCLVSKLAEENPPFFPSCFLHVLQSDINHVLFFFLALPKNVGFISLRTIKLQVTSFPHPSFCKTMSCNYSLFVGFVDPCRWSVCNSFCFSPGNPLALVFVCSVSAVAATPSLLGLVALFSSPLPLKAIKWWKRRMRNNEQL